MPMPSSRAVGTTSASMSRLHSDHSLCSAAIGCTALARRSVSGRGLRQAQVADLSGGHQLGHGPHRLLDGHAAVGAVLVVEVDVVDTQPAERRFAGLAHVGRRHPGWSGRQGRRCRTMPNLVASTTSSRRPRWPDPPAPR